MRFKEIQQIRLEQAEQRLRDKYAEENKDKINEDKRRKFRTKPNPLVSQEAKDTDPEEYLEMKKEFMRDRATYEDELEDKLIKK